jgi:hypothetical protein
MHETVNTLMNVTRKGGQPEGGANVQVKAVADGTDCIYRSRTVRVHTHET